MSECLKAFHKEQKCLPNKVIVYRDGVGDGQFDVVASHQCPQIYESFHRAGGQEYKAKMAYIVVKEKDQCQIF